MFALQRWYLTEQVKIPEEKRFLLRTLTAKPEVILALRRKRAARIYREIDTLVDSINAVSEDVFRRIEQFALPIARFLGYMFNPERDDFMGVKLRELYERQENVLGVVG